MIKLYQNENNNYVLELWGASTKHPDSIFHMEDYEVAWWVNKEDPEQMRGQVFQWLLECASKMNLPMHAEMIADYAWKNWRIWRQGLDIPVSA